MSGTVHTRYEALDSADGRALRLLNAGLGKRQWVTVRGPDSGPGKWDPATNTWMVRVVDSGSPARDGGIVAWGEGLTLADAADACREALATPAPRVTAP